MILHPINNPKEKLCEGKKATIGVFDDLIKDTNTSLLDQNHAIFPDRRFKRKSWIFTGIYTKDLYIGFAIVDAGYLAKAFSYVYIPSKNIHFEHGIDKVFGMKKDFSANLNEAWKLGNYEINKTGKEISFTCKTKDYSLDIKLNLNANGLSFVCPSEPVDRPFHFTYKNHLLPVQIKFKTKNETIQRNDLFASLDYSKGYPPHKTNWNWMSFTGQANQQYHCGINLVDQFNDNMENFMWMDNERIELGNVVFDLPAKPEKSKWVVESSDTKLYLTMNPIGFRKEHINLKWIKSKFIQVFGQIEGSFQYQNKTYHLNGHGVMEDHQAIW